MCSELILDEPVLKASVIHRQNQAHRRNGSRDELAPHGVKLTLEQPSVNTWSTFVLSEMLHLPLKMFNVN